MNSLSLIGSSGRDTAKNTRAGLGPIRALLLGMSLMGTGSAALMTAQTFSDFSVPSGYPAVIATGPDGNLWFTEPMGDKIGRITTAGVITEFSLPSGSRPFGIAAGPDGSLWFAEQSGKIGRITPNGVISEILVPTQGFPKTTPTSIAVGSDGNLWFTQADVSWIGRITLAGVVTHFNVGYDGPFAITSGSDGNLWFTVRAHGESKICKITTAGVSTAFGRYGQFSDPAGITAGPDGNIWFTDAGWINRITTAGAITQFPVPRGGNPVGITTGPDGNLWFAEMSTNKIGRITTGGVITEFQIPTPGSGPTWITTGPDGNLWFSEEWASRIGRLTLAAPGACVPDATTLCLNSGRFRIRAQWSARDGSTGSGQAVRLTADAGYFTFFDANNVEVLVKILNGCGFNSRYWVFGSGLTDVHVLMTVVDTQTDAVKSYESQLGTPFQPIQDTTAFASCP